MVFFFWWVVFFFYFNFLIYKNVAVYVNAGENGDVNTAARLNLFVFFVVKKRGGGSITRARLSGFFWPGNKTPPPGTTGITANRAAFSHPYL
ncbi:hypothetical protein, partial [Enterobacter hormaechei]